MLQQTTWHSAAADLALDPGMPIPHAGLDIIVAAQDSQLSSDFTVASQPICDGMQMYRGIQYPDH